MPFRYDVEFTGGRVTSFEDEGEAWEFYRKNKIKKSAEVPRKVFFEEEKKENEIPKYFKKELKEREAEPPRPMRSTKDLFGL